MCSVNYFELSWTLCSVLSLGTQLSCPEVVSLAFFLLLLSWFLFQSGTDAALETGSTNARL